ncbi:anti-sigma regulatory factor [Mariprofundus ferrooxydans]|uniref:anti-sigma regulatory factor n=1 Tax=Mariprofundus ferrooxydans TaxID=314344 RepID=UPI00143095C4|nr:anti-sigma regulatory factor [Mariprofundus ferrooxydans]
MDSELNRSENALTAYERIELTHDRHILLIRQKLREIAHQLNLGMAAKTRAIMCATELAENVLRHAGCGWCEICLATRPDGVNTLQLVVQDQGHGIDQLSHVLGERFDVETSPLGTGLPGVRRVADFFHITSKPDGTSVRVEFLLPKKAGL